MTAPLPRTQLRLAFAQAGDTWDAVEVSALVGEQAIEALGDQCGGVILNPDSRRMWFLIAPDCGSGWQLPGVAVRGRGSFIYFPADDVTTAPGTHWTREARHEQRLTPGRQLHAALAKAAKS